MKKILFKMFAIYMALIVLPVFAQIAVTQNPDHKSMLASNDPKLAANKKLVYDFWREVLEAGHMEKAPIYMDENYIQHNPTVATGRQAFIDFFSKIRKPQTISERVTAPLVSITAEGNLVTLSFVAERKEPKDPTKTYTTTWFDMFRVENGKVMEHWDSMQKM